MTSYFYRYLQEIGRRLRLDPKARREVLRELQSHLEDKAAELQQKGFSAESAWRLTLQAFGSPVKVADELYAAHSRASVVETCLAALPHVLFAFLFAFHLWTAAGFLAVFLMLATVTTVIAWRKGPPVWVYPWLGYCLVAPAAIWLFAFPEVSYATLKLVARGTPGMSVLVYLTGTVYVLLAVRLAWRLLVRVIERDWLFASLMVFPFPVLVSWLVYLNRNGGVFSYDPQPLLQVDGATSLVFLALAAVTAVMYRVGSRVTKVITLAVGMPIAAMLASQTHLGAALGGGALLLIALSLGCLALPALLDGQLERSDRTA
ncbi:MAG: hypothetical protein FJ315_04000 [SAR202 cluster bacterium]|nr:hypothetical protein [SAR202 cluster bacterium]